MLDTIIKDRKYRDMMVNHVQDMIGYLIDRGISFTILCNVDVADFDPKLPEEISKNFKSITMFVLAGYTFESATCDSENLYFEAGFGPENIGSYVTVPLYSILQLIVDESVLFINLSAGNDEIKIQKEEDEGVKKSMDALLSNPENQKFHKGK